MNAPAKPVRKLPQPRWLTVSEIVGVLALLIAGLGYWDAHRDRREADHEKAAVAVEAVAGAPLVLTGQAVDDGARLALRPMRADQAVQTQRYVFPRAVLDHAMEVDAAQPQIDRAWMERGLKQALQAAGAPRFGEGALPVAIVTTFIEDGRTHTDEALYRVGYTVRPGGFLRGETVRLQGLSLVSRGLKGDPQKAADARWAPRLE